MKRKTQVLGPKLETKQRTNKRGCKKFRQTLANPPFGKKSSTVIVGEDGRSSTEKDTIERDDLNEFVDLYNPANRNQRTATWSAYSYDELIARDKASLDIFWLKDDSLAESDNNVASMSGELHTDW